MTKRPVNPKRFLSVEEVSKIEQTIKETESLTSAEIKVVLLGHCWRDIRDKAAQIFIKHKLDKTEQRNCVMILLVTANREFLIYGDRGIHTKAGQRFWNDVRDKMTAKFKTNDFSEGICEGVRLAGEKLSCFFPIQPNDKQEISNHVIFEK